MPVRTCREIKKQTVKVSEKSVNWKKTKNKKKYNNNTITNNNHNKAFNYIEDENENKRISNKSNNDNSNNNNNLKVVRETDFKRKKLWLEQETSQNYTCVKNTSATWKTT